MPRAHASGWRWWVGMRMMLRYHMMSPTRYRKHHKSSQDYISLAAPPPSPSLGVVFHRVARFETCESSRIVARREARDTHRTEISESVFEGILRPPRASRNRRNGHLRWSAAAARRRARTWSHAISGCGRCARCGGFGRRRARRRARRCAAAGRRRAPRSARCARCGVAGRRRARRCARCGAGGRRAQRCFRCARYASFQAHTGSGVEREGWRSKTLHVYLRAAPLNTTTGSPHPPRAPQGGPPRNLHKCRLRALRSNAVRMRGAARAPRACAPHALVAQAPRRRAPARAARARVSASAARARPPRERRI